MSSDPPLGMGVGVWVYKNKMSVYMVRLHGSI